MLKEKQLIWRFNRGSKDALKEIYELYRDDLLRIATGLLTDKGLAEDAVHHVFMKLAGMTGQLRLKQSLKGYLICSVANCVRNMNRQAGRKACCELDTVEEPIAKRRGPGEWIVFHEELELLYEAMKQLPYEQREVVLFRLVGDMPFKAIAREQDCSIKTVMSRYRYGIEKLRSLCDIDNEV